MSDSATIYSFRKNPTEEVRVSLRKYDGSYFFDLRVFVEKETGHCKFLPTRKGLTLNVYVFPELKRAVLALEDELKQWGLLEQND